MLMKQSWIDLIHICVFKFYVLSLPWPNHIFLTKWKFHCGALELRELDLSNLPDLSDNGVLQLAKSRIPFFELRMRQCPLIGDTSIIALASMLVDEARWHRSSLRLLDLYNCGGITQLAFRWL
ncbi:hypothetical protein RIF29_39430 [Crotalaria pallida]|uniref:F-box/LRR-repeat protein 15-like leucin rich repeat domain-containing protein n=1 Tax=Crotalaria pallida TaxID=3830 RepID=A0AAN9HPS1_CROPI